LAAMTNMTTIRHSRHTDDSAYISVIWFAAIFALVTYAAISLRAVLSPFEVNSFIDAKRGFSVVIGAFILWLAIRAAERNRGDSLGAQIFAILNVAIPGAIGLLLAREAYDLVMSGELAQRLALNVRWMLTWIGYFAAAVAGFLALGYYRQLQMVEEQGGHRAKDMAVHPTPPAQARYEVADLEFDPRSGA
jgi:hypothetical protein